MSAAEDVTAYALLGMSLSDTERREVMVVLAPIMSAFVHVTSRGAELLGVTPAEFIADVRRDRLEPPDR